MVLYLGAAPRLVPTAPLTGLPPRRRPRRGRYLVPRFGPRVCSPRRYARATQRPCARYTSTHDSPPHVLASWASRRAFSALASFSSRLAAIFTVFSRLRSRVQGSPPSLPHRSHTGHSPDTRRTLAVDNFDPPRGASTLRRASQYQPGQRSAGGRRLNPATLVKLPVNEMDVSQPALVRQCAPQIPNHYPCFSQSVRG
jgi:hypothetical protein